MGFFTSIPTDSTVEEVFKMTPAYAVPLLRYHEAVLRGAESPLTVAQRELIAGYVSGLNACNFCHGAHAGTAEALGIPAGLIRNLVDDLETADVDPGMKILLRYVRKLTESPSRMTQADADAVFKAGWDERALHDAIHVCCLYNFMNRLVEGHGIKSGDVGRSRAPLLATYGYAAIIKELGLE